jgi:hypothetical protein
MLHCGQKYSLWRDISCFGPITNCWIWFWNIENETRLFVIVPFCWTFYGRDISFFVSVVDCWIWNKRPKLFSYHEAPIFEYHHYKYNYLWHVLWKLWKLLNKVWYCALKDALTKNEEYSVNPSIWKKLCFRKTYFKNAGDNKVFNGTDLCFVVNKGMPCRLSWVLCPHHSLIFTNTVIYN